MQTGGFSPKEYLNSIISSTSPPPALNPADFATLGGHKIGISEPKFSFPRLLDLEKKLLAKAEHASIQKPVSIADESHETMGGEIQKTNEVFHETVESLTDSEIAGGEQLLEELAKDEETIIEMSKEEPAHEKETIDGFDSEAFSKKLDALEDYFDTFVEVPESKEKQAHEKETIDGFDSEVFSKKLDPLEDYFDTFVEVPTSKDNETVIPTDLNKIKAANIAQKEKLSTNQISYNKFEELTKKLAASDKLKLKNKNGELVLEKTGFLQRIKNFFSTNKSKSAQGYIKNFLDIAKRDIKNGQYQYKSAERKVKDISILIKDFEKTSYANILRSHNDEIDWLLDDVKEEATRAKEKTLSNYDRTIDLVEEMKNYTPSDNVSGKISEVIDTERNYIKGLSSLVNKDWTLRNGQKGNFFDLLLEKGVINAKKHKVIVSTYENAHNQASLFNYRLGGDKASDDARIDLYMYLDATADYMNDYLDSMNQIQEIYNAEVAPLVAKLKKDNPRLLDQYVEKNNREFESDMITPLQRAPRHDILLGEIAKDPSLADGTRDNLVKFIDNTRGYIRDYMS